MPLTSGDKLGPYEIVAPLGAGGMGEVYRARDSRLGRDVALKILPESFARDKDRLEARSWDVQRVPLRAVHDRGSGGTPSDRMRMRYDLLQ